MNVLLDGLSVLGNHWRLVFGILLLLIVGQFVAYFAIKQIFDDRLTADEYYSLGLAGWMLPILLVSMLWFLCRTVQALHFDLLIAAAAIALLAVLLYSRSKEEVSRESKVVNVVLLLLFGIFILLRLVFVSQAILPLYFDSAEHYRIIKSLLGQLELSNATSSFTWPTTNYYHIGFHLLTLFITSIMQTEITDTMLILGQMILAVIPLSIFFIIKHETKSNSAGIFAVLLAAFGWYMPAHVIDWGKYPALTSLVLIQFVLSMAYLSAWSRRTLSRWGNWALYGMLGLGILISGFVHSRSLVILGIAFLAWIAATWWQKLPSLPRSFAFFVIILGIIAEYIFIQRQDVLTLVFDPYIQKGFLVTFIILFLSIFALKAYPQLTFSTVLAIFLLLASLFVPVRIPGYVDLTLLDRPFVEMILYLPLSLIGGLGLSGLEHYLGDSQIKLGTSLIVLGKYVSVLFIGLVLINAVFQYGLYPSDCCEIVSTDDLVAIDWMDKHLPPDARILIASTELQVLPSDSFQGYASSDAGAWITPLIGRATVPFPYYSDLGQQTSLNTLCEMKVNYLYVGEIGPTFDDSQISIHPDWYKILLSMPKVKIYQVIGCDYRLSQ